MSFTILSVAHATNRINLLTFKKHKITFVRFKKHFPTAAHCKKCLNFNCILSKDIHFWVRKCSITILFFGYFFITYIIAAFYFSTTSQSWKNFLGILKREVCLLKCIPMFFCLSLFQLKKVNFLSALKRNPL